MEKIIDEQLKLLKESKNGQKSRRSSLLSKKISALILKFGTKAQRKQCKAIMKPGKGGVVPRSLAEKELADLEASKKDMVTSILELKKMSPDEIYKNFGENVDVIKSFMKEKGYSYPHNVKSLDKVIVYLMTGIEKAIEANPDLQEEE